MTFWATAVSMVLSSLTVEAPDGLCPSAGQVEARFRQLAPNHQSMHRAQLVDGGAPHALELILRDEAGVVLASRRLEAASCAAATEAAAATILAWEVLFPGPPSPPVEARPRSPLPSAPDQSEAPPKTVAFAYRLSGALLAAVSGTSVRPGAQVAFEAGPLEALWFARVSVAAAWPFDTPLAGGRVAWFRPTWAALGFGLRVFDSEPWHATTFAAFEAGEVRAWGQGYETNNTARAFDPAVGAGIQVRRELLPHLALSAEVGASIYLISQITQVAGILATLPLPPVTWSLRVGLAWGT